MPRFNTTAYTSPQNRRLSLARRGGYPVNPSSCESDTSDSDSCFSTDDDRLKVTRPTVSLPSFQEFLTSVSSAPSATHSLSVFHQTDATHLWYNHTHSYKLNPILYEHTLRQDILQDIGHIQLRPRTERLSLPALKVDASTTSQSNKSLPVVKKCQPASGTVSKAGYDIEAVLNPEWLKYADMSMTEFGKPVLVCCWDIGEGRTCQYYNLKNALVQRHIEHKHLGLRPHACRYCEKSFAQKTTRDVHEWKLHTFEMPLGCDHCTKRFNDPARLSKHRSKFHGIKAQARKEKPKLV
ncbi:hypothetical protein BDQ17DRAFT_1373199 [Cyathus striatus]|nr:hypothetical protein BDQ17DRAFT_1373199 [Cyathus striatus]